MHLTGYNISTLPRLDLLLVTFVYFEVSKDKDYVRFGGMRERIVSEALRNANPQ